MIHQSLKQVLVESIQKISKSEFERIAPSIKLYQYTKELEKDLAPRSIPLLSVYSNPELFLKALIHDDPASLVAAVDLIAAIYPPAIEEKVIESLKYKPWRTFQDALLNLLGVCDSEASFLALITANPWGSRQLRQNRYEGGCNYVHNFLMTDSVVQDFHSVPQPTYQRWNTMTTEARTAWSDEAKRYADIYSYDELNLRQTFLYYLADKGCYADLQMLRKLWTSHPAKAVRLGAGYTLLKLSKTEELSPLSEHIFSVDRPIHSVALVALIQQNPKTAASRLKNKMQSIGMNVLAPENSAFVIALLNVLSRDPNDSKEHPWVLQDEQWIELFLELKTIKERRQTASEFLSMFPNERVAAYQKNSTRPKPLTVKLPDGDMLIEQFTAGASAEVWTHLIALKEQVRKPKIKPHAENISRETMKGIRRTLELIARRLTNEGYVFFAKPLDELNEDALLKQVNLLEKKYKPLPMALKAMYLHVGGCDFRGYHPDWPTASTNQPGFNSRQDKVAWYTNPLVIANVSEALEITKDTSAEDTELPFCGDEISKAGYSGGHYSILVPDENVDAILIGESKSRYLVEYLRYAIHWAGLPGLANITERPQKLIDSVTSDLPYF